MIAPCRNALITSQYTSADCHVPHTRRQPKKDERSRIPFANCKFEPVNESLSRNQCILRKGEESS